MRWSKEIKVMAKKPFKRIPRPEIGDEKIEIKFAYFPTNITNTDYVWLENYEIVYEFKEIKELIYNYNTYEDGTLCKGPLSKISTGEFSTTKEWIEKRKQYHEKK